MSFIEPTKQFVTDKWLLSALDGNANGQRPNYDEKRKKNEKNVGVVK